MKVKDKLTEALEKVKKELIDYDTRNSQQNDFDLSKSALVNIKMELEKMYEIMDKSKYEPSYSRFLLDYPETELIEYLINVAYLYKQNT